MFIARVLSKIYKKEDGVILIDYAGQKYICGNPNKENPKEYNYKTDDDDQLIVLCENGKIIKNIA